MTNELTTFQDIPAPTPELTKSLSPLELQEHRNRIGAEVRIVLSAYFQPSEAQEVRTGQLAWWCDELQDWGHEQIVWGLREWNRMNPRLRPTPGDIVSLLKAKRGEAWRKANPSVKAEASRHVPTAEERAKVADYLAQAGFAPKRMDGAA